MQTGGTSRRPIEKSCEEAPVVPPPATSTVDFERRPVLYDAEGKPLVRKVGYR